MADKTVSYKISADSSEFLKAIKQAEDALKKLGSGSGSGGGGGSKPGGSGGGLPADIKKTLASYDAIAKNDQRLNQLQGAQSYFKKGSSQAKDLAREMDGLYKANIKYAQSEQEIVQAVQKRVQFQKQNQQNLSNKPGGALNTLNNFARSQFLRDIGQRGQAMYNQGIGSYSSFAESAGINNAFTQSQRRLQASQLNLGRNLSGYQTAKNGLEAGFNNSPLAAPFAIGADVLGKGLDIAGTLLPAVVGLKELGKLGKALPGVTKAATAIEEEAGVITQVVKGGGGGFLANLAKGLPVSGAGGTLAGLGVAPLALGGGALAGQWIGNGIAKKLDPNAKEQSLGDTFDTGRKLLALGFGGGNKTATSDLASLLKVGPNTGADLGSGWADLMGDHRGAQKIRTQNVEKDTFKDLSTNITKMLDGIFQGSKNLEELKSGSAFKFQSVKIANSVSDQNYEFAKSMRLTQRDADRGIFDRNLSRSRTNEDYGVELQKIGVSRGRAVEDNNRDISRLSQDYQTNRTRNEYDYKKAVETNSIDITRVRRDTAIQSQRIQEDYSRNYTRLIADTTKSAVRLEQDSATSLQRIGEDSARNRTRTEQDYSRSILELDRNTARSKADLKQGLQDTTISLFAPGLASNKAYVYSKALRDYNKQSSRIDQDSQFNREGINLSRGRSLEDIGREETRGTFDVNKGLDRGRADIAQDQSRGAEDLARERTRASLDLLNHSTDANADSQRNLTQINVEHGRSVTDMDKSFNRGMEDISRNFSRTMADLAIAEKDASRQHDRALMDLSIAEKRAAEDTKEAFAAISHAASTAARDMNVMLSEVAQDLAKKAGLDPGTVSVGEVKNAGGIGDVATGPSSSSPYIGGSSGIGSNPNSGPASIGGSNGAGTNIGGNDGNIGGGNSNTIGGGGGGNIGGSNSGVSMLPVSLQNLLKRQGGQVPSYAVGSSFIPYDQLALVHQGEAIIPKYAMTNEGVSLASGSQFNPDGSRKTIDQINASTPYARTSEGVSLQNGSTTGEGRGGVSGSGNFMLGSDGRSDPNSNLRYGFGNGTWHGFQNPAWGGGGNGYRVGFDRGGRRPSIFDQGLSGDRMGIGPTMGITPPASSFGGSSGGVSAFGSGGVHLNFTVNNDGEQRTISSVENKLRNVISNAFSGNY